MSLLEVNPLIVLKNGRLRVLDAKVSFDNNALFRHPELAELRDISEEDEKEIEASKFDLAYVALDGNIGCMVNGAGLAMATMDIIKLYGAEPANFLDVGGGASKEKVTAAFKIITADPAVKGILVNIFGGIMKCDIIAEGVIAAVKEVGLKVPLVVRLEGTNVELGKKILNDSGLNVISADDLDDAAQEDRRRGEEELSHAAAQDQPGRGRRRSGSRRSSTRTSPATSTIRRPRSRKFGEVFDWHAHDNEDEAFLVLRGRIAIDFRDGAVELGEGDFIVVPKDGRAPAAIADDGAGRADVRDRPRTLNTGNANSDLTARPQARMPARHTSARRHQCMQALASTADLHGAIAAFGPVNSSSKRLSCPFSSTRTPRFSCRA